MDNQEFNSIELNLTTHEMMAEIARIRANRAELAQLRARMAALEGRSNPQPLSNPRPQPAITSRRKMLGQIGGSLVAASLGASLPVFLTFAAQPQQTAPDGFSSLAGFKKQSASAIRPNSIPPRPPTGSVTQTFSGYDFHPINSATTFTSEAAGGISSTGGLASFYCRLELPEGAKVINVGFYFTDNDASDNLTFVFGGIKPGTDSSLLITGFSSSGASNLNTYLNDTGTAAAPLVIIDNYAYSYQLYCIFTSGSDNQILWGAQVTLCEQCGPFPGAIKNSYSAKE